MFVEATTPEGTMSATVVSQRDRFTNPSVGDLAEYLLRKQSHLALRRVWCEENAPGSLVLRGCVPSYYLRQLAENTVAQVEGIRRLVNEIEVLGDMRTVAAD